MEEHVNRQKETQEKRKGAFLVALAANYGNVSRAAEAVSIPRCSVYQWRHEDEAFAKAWDNVIESAIDAAEQELYRRAVDGVDEPVYQKGECVGTIRRYSDTALIFLLKGRRPETWNPPQKIAATNVEGTAPAPLLVAHAEMSAATKEELLAKLEGLRASLADSPANGTPAES